MYTVLHGPIQPVVIEAAGRLSAVVVRFLHYLVARWTTHLQLHQAESAARARSS